MRPTPFFQLDEGADESIRTARADQGPALAGFDWQALGAGAVGALRAELAPARRADDHLHPRHAARQPAQVDRRAGERPAAQVDDAPAVDVDGHVPDAIAARAVQPYAERAAAHAAAL